MAVEKPVRPAVAGLTVKVEGLDNTAKFYEFKDKNQTEINVTLLKVRTPEDDLTPEAELLLFGACHAQMTRHLILLWSYCGCSHGQTWPSHRSLLP